MSIYLYTMIKKSLQLPPDELLEEAIRKSNGLLEQFSKKDMNEKAVEPKIRRWEMSGLFPYIISKGVIVFRADDKVLFWM